MSKKSGTTSATISAEAESPSELSSKNVPAIPQSTPEKLTFRTFMNKVLAGTAVGVVVGVIPNAVISAIFKFFLPSPFAAEMIHIVQIFQIATPLFIGALIAMQLELKPMQTVVVAGVAFVSSGVLRFNPQMLNETTHKAGALIGAGTGDLINTMLMAALCAAFLIYLGDALGSTALITMPLVVGTIACLIGVTTLPYVDYITLGIGYMIQYFTTLEPILMTILICCSFSLIIISPVSTVATGLAIQIHGISAGAAAMGVTATTLVLLVHSWGVNKSGVFLTVALGGMKAFMPNLFRHPIMIVPTFFTAIISAIPISFFNVAGDPISAGLGLIGLAGPLKSMELGLNVTMAFILWFVVPLVASIIGRILFTKILHLYETKVIFKYLG